MRHIRWFLFILGLTLGFIFGLYYAWEISPIDPRESKPADLQIHYQVEYQTLIALAYANTGNLSRAIRRFDSLPETITAETLRALSQRHLAEGRPQEEVLAVAQLASALSNPIRQTSLPPQISGTITPTSQPTRTPTMVASPTYSPTPKPVYQLRSMEKICDPSLSKPLIQVMLVSSSGDPVPGVEVFVLWEGGEDHFFTGLKPEISPGYGDFTMSPDITYTVLAGSSEPVTLPERQACIEEGQQYPASWFLLFESF